MKILTSQLTQCLTNTFKMRLLMKKVFKHTKQFQKEIFKNVSGYNDALISYSSPFNVMYTDANKNTPTTLYSLDFTDSVCIYGLNM